MYQVTFNSLNLFYDYDLQVATDGDKVLVQLKVAGTPTPEITWFFNKKEIKPSAVSI